MPVQSIAGTFQKNWNPRSNLHLGYKNLSLDPDSFATHAHPMILPECQEIASLTQSLQDVSKRLANATHLPEPWMGQASEIQPIRWECMTRPTL